MEGVCAALYYGDSRGVFTCLNPVGHSGPHFSCQAGRGSDPLYQVQWPNPGGPGVDLAREGYPPVPRGDPPPPPVPLPPETHFASSSCQKTEDLAIKFDTGKPRYDLLPSYPLAQLVAVYTFGAAKYAPEDWRKGMSWRRVFAAALRHLWAFFSGEDCDEESGLPHLAHAAWNCFTLLEFMRSRREFDDRPEIGYNGHRAYES